MKRFAGLKDLIHERFPSRKESKLQDDERLVTLQVGKTVWDQSPRQMRVELWMSSLQRRGVGVAAAAKFEDTLLTPVSVEAVNDIEKDIARTFPNTKRFAATEGQDALRRVLHAYAAYDPEVGYCQGMNFVAGLLLMYLPERHAFGGLVVLMQDRGLRKYFSTDMSLLQTHLWQLGRLISPKLCAHLESHGVLPLLYAASWLMTCFSADFPASFSARVMDVILHGWMMDQALLKTAVAVLTRCETRLLQLNEMEECLQLIKNDVPAWEEPILHDVLTDAFSKPWTAQQLMLINSTEGAESVAEACERVQQANTEAAEAAAAAATGTEPPRSLAAAGSSREQRLSDGSSTGERRTSDSSTGWFRPASASTSPQPNGSSGSKQGSRVGAGGDGHHDLLRLGQSNGAAEASITRGTACFGSESGLSINTSRHSVSPTAEKGSFLIDLESPRSESSSVMHAAALAAPAAQDSEDWDPFILPPWTARSTSVTGSAGSIFSQAQRHLSLACGSSQSFTAGARGGSLSGLSRSHSQAVQHQHTLLSPQRTPSVTVQDLRQQLGQLSFSQSSQQQGSRLEQKGARLELLEQLNRQQQMLQRCYSLTGASSLQSPLSSASRLPTLQQPSEQQQQQASGFGGSAIARLGSDDWSDFQ